MTRLIWGELSDRNFEFGVDRGVFYPPHDAGHAWGGLISVKEETIDASQSLIYIDGEGHQNRLLIGSFAAVISAVTYPDAFEPYDGYSGIYSAQRRSGFNFSYRTMQANGHYKIHLVYNATASPTDRNHSTINTSVDMELFEWNLTTKPVVIQSAKASSHFVIDTMQINPVVIDEIETILYGDAETTPSMPTVNELLAIFDAHAILRITDHGDGTWTAEGPDDVVKMLDATTFEIDWPSVIYDTEDKYTVRSL